MANTDDKIRDLCARAIAAEGEDFNEAMAEVRRAIRRSCDGLENATLASALKVSKVVKMSSAKRREKDRKSLWKRAA